VYKVAWLVKLAGTEDRAERSRRWSEEHSELMRAVPGLERHTVNRGLAIAEGPGAGREAPPVDGVACAWFTDRAAFEFALSSPQWQRVLDHGREIFNQAWEQAGQAVEIEERIMRDGPGTPWSGAGVPPGMCKHIGVLEFRRDLTRDAGRAWWADVHGPVALRIPEIRYYVQNHATRALRLDGRTVTASLPSTASRRRGSRIGRPSSAPMPPPRGSRSVTTRQTCSTCRRSTRASTWSSTKA
jgi:uncharacterized protein (TIGR02118 family)